MSYNVLANYYDSMTDDMEYERRAEYMLSLFLKYDREPTVLLDAACGTGAFSLIFAERGMYVAGVDVSSDMLAEAQRKADCVQEENVMFLCQPLQRLKLHGTVDGAICCIDSLNHIVRADILKKAFERIALFLEPGRLFIFDVNTEYKHRHILSGQCFTAEDYKTLCVWQCSECNKNGVVEIYLDFFTELENGLYKRQSEDFKERAYSVDELKQMLSEAGLETVAVLGDMSYKKPKEDEQRIYFVTRRSVQ